MWIYKPWLEKLNLSEPKTLDEFYNVLKAFKEKDPNGNGLADEIPFIGATSGGENWFCDFIAQRSNQLIFKAIIYILRMEKLKRLMLSLSIKRH